MPWWAIVCMAIVGVIRWTRLQRERNRENV